MCSARLTDELVKAYDLQKEVTVCARGTAALPLLPPQGACRFHTDSYVRFLQQISHNGIDIVDEARRVYNRPCSNRPELDAKGFDKTKEAVAKKAADYFACFASRVEVLDVVSQRPILADATAFRARFQTVFRESGRELQLRVRRGTSSGGHHFKLRDVVLTSNSLSPCHDAGGYREKHLSLIHI